MIINMKMTLGLSNTIVISIPIKMNNTNMDLDRMLLLFIRFFRASKAFYSCMGKNHSPCDQYTLDHFIFCENDMPTFVTFSCEF